MTIRLFSICFLTFIIQSIATLAYAARPAGVRTKKIALALSIWNVFFLISSAATTIQAPLLGKLLDAAAKSTNDTSDIILTFRLIMLSSSIGVAFSAIFLRNFTDFFSRIIRSYDNDQTAFQILLHGIRPAFLYKAFCQLKPDLRSLIEDAGRSLKNHYKMALFHALTIMLWTVGMLSSLYAGYLRPDLVRTTANLTGIVNGVATVVLVTTIDPRVAAITDECASGVREASHLDGITSILIITRFLGTLLGQVIFMAVTHFVIFIASML